MSRQDIKPPKGITVVRVFEPDMDRQVQALQTYYGWLLKEHAKLSADPAEGEGGRFAHQLCSTPLE